MSIFQKLFSRPRAAVREIAPQLTQWERRSLVPSNVPPGGIPYAVYDQMQRDAMVQTALTVKKLGILATPWRVVSESAERRAFVEECFARMEGSPTSILMHAMDAFAKGWSVQELLFEERDGFIWLAGTRAKNPALFGLDVDRFGRLESLRLELPGEAAVVLPRERFAIYTYQSGYGHPKGVSDLDAAHGHYLQKNALLDAWRLHLERFGSPTMLGRYQRGLSADEQGSILSALKNLAKNTAIVFPSEIEIDAVPSGQAASAGFMEAIEFHNREIARSILGQTLTTDEGRRVGSLALGKIHLQVLLLQLQALRTQLADLVMTEQVIRPLVEMNFGPGEVPKFEFEPVRLEAFASGAI
ncbi:MAG: phage portal protein family protein [Fimbriimonas sp.]